MINLVKNFEPLLNSNSILEHRRQNGPTNKFLMAVLVKYIILKKIKIWV